MDRPTGRKRNESGTTGNFSKGDKVETNGPVGSSDGYKSRKEQKQEKRRAFEEDRQERIKKNEAEDRARAERYKTAVNGKQIILAAVVIVLVFFFMGGGANLIGGYNPMTGESYGSSTSGSASSTSTDLSSLGLYAGNSSISTGWSDTDAQQASLNTEVSAKARDKRTRILGNGEDVVTIMIYMCGTDLESQNGMATKDLQEMASGIIEGSNVNLIVYTGGCRSWRNNIVDSSVNQIYEVGPGKLTPLVSNAGKASMTNPSTLSSFIQFCAENYEANRYELILWDHGGGSVSGYGYDEKYSSSGSMTLDGIQTALEDGGVTFDFIGFDACLMATAETAFMLEPYADYMIASEETEPGIGWYYTDWLKALIQNTSISTPELGQTIVDSFVKTCASQCYGQAATLSVTDLAEFSYAVPDALNAFARSITEMITKDGQYRTVSNARNQTREFATSSRIDQIDLYHFAMQIGNTEGSELMAALKSAVKYNRTSSNMTNAYGISIYFPYQRTSYVDKAVSTYKSIGMDDDYSTCIREFASMEVSGQASHGGTSSPSYLFQGNSSDYYSGYSSSDLISGLLQSFLGGDTGSVSGMDGFSQFFGGRSLTDQEITEYIIANSFDPSQLVWTQNEDGEDILTLSEDQWALVHDLELNAFVKDDDGYIDLGLDTIFTFDEEGNLIADDNRSWMAINDQPVACYRMSTTTNGEEYSIVYRVPALYNDVQSELIVVYDSSNEGGYVAGVRPVYADGETDQVAKAATEMAEGDTIQFICDYYTLEGEYEGSYKLGSAITVGEDGADGLTLSDVSVPSGTTLLISYRFTDIYNEEYWTPALER
ncbi:MAG: peptidase C11 [Lachnospiraceae bacterium]|nr:peptidase C11 [Lachnospiraceae bacterium]